MGDFAVNFFGNSGKFIQIICDGKYIIKFGSGGDFHNDMLKDFLNENEVPYEVFGSLGSPLERGDGYFLAGAGYYRLGEMVENELKVYLEDESETYRKGPSRSHLEKMGNCFEGIELVVLKK